MNMNEVIARINELAKKAKSPEGLSPEETAERDKLRRIYIDSVVGNLKGQLENTTIVQGPVAWDVRNEIRNYLTEYADKYQEESPGFMDLRIVDYQAIDALKEYGFIE